MMDKEVADEHKYSVGDKITAKINHTTRGGEIIGISDEAVEAEFVGILDDGEGTVKAEFYCPHKRVVELGEDEFVLSENWSSDMELPNKE